VIAVVCSKMVDIGEKEGDGERDRETQKGTKRDGLMLKALEADVRDV